jgi:predicted dehydrogenase
MSQLTRRTFLKGAAAAAAAYSLPAKTYAAANGANSQLRVAVVGFNGRGQSHISGYSGLSNMGVRITALCDVDSKVLEKGVGQLKNKGVEVEPFSDVRKLLENKDIDMVSFATPNHWHSLGAIWALQAGKDVYVEKPVSHNVWEGRQLVNAATKSGKIVQMGVQSRSAYGIQKAVEWAAAGNLGKLIYSRGLCYKRRPSIGKADAPLEFPPEIDKDLWFGPAQIHPIMRKKLHYDWHWQWDTGNGDLGNQGIHQMDIARRFIGEPTVAPGVFSIGGRLGYIDDGETANTQIIFQDYEKAPLIFEVRGLPASSDSKEMDKYRGASIGVVVQYENGHIVVPNYNDAYAYDKDGQEIQKFTAPKKGEPGHDEVNEDHFKNFVEAVVSRDHNHLNGKILDGHLSSAMCHTGNISYRLGQKKNPDELREAVKGNKEAMDSLQRMVAHLTANQVDVNVDKLTLGEFLKMDVQTERFIGHPEADKLLTRDYRAPFVVPEIKA